MARAPRRHPRRPDAGPLSPELVNVLLFGWSAPEAHSDDPFAVFDYTDEQFARIWREHRATLMAEWRRRGESGSPWAVHRFEQRTTALPNQIRGEFAEFLLPDGVAR